MALPPLVPSQPTVNSNATFVIATIIVNTVSTYFTIIIVSVAITSFTIGTMLFLLLLVEVVEHNCWPWWRIVLGEVLRRKKCEAQSQWELESQEVHPGWLGGRASGRAPDDWTTSLTLRVKTYYRRVWEFQMEVCSSVRGITRSLEKSTPSDRAEEHLRGVANAVQWKLRDIRNSSHVSRAV